MSIKEHPPRRRPSDDERLHVPVLVDSMIDTMKPQSGETYLDLTAGYGGHASAFTTYTHNASGMVLVDRDSNAIRELELFAKNGATILHSDFVSAANELVRQECHFDLICVDLGVSSPQLDQSQRGFSFTSEGPLDMRMDDQLRISAADIVNTASESELLHILMTYGEERLGFARRVVRAIRMNRPIQTTKELADLIVSTHHGPWQRTHPATRTFQALRIAVNDELTQVESLLPLLPKLLNTGGRVGVISFHSLEDRLVKRFFKEQDEAGFESELRLLTKKPYRGVTDDVHNPRARSATLRIAVKK